MVPFRLMYVFNPQEETGYVCRVPRVLAEIVTAPVFRTGLDFAPTTGGLAKGERP